MTAEQQRPHEDHGERSVDRFDWDHRASRIELVAATALIGLLALVASGLVDSMLPWVR
jgi:hypothetical protein